MTQTDRILIALTKPGPRTARNIAVETRIPAPSVRRVLATIDAATRAKAQNGVR